MYLLLNYSANIQICIISKYVIICWWCIFNICRKMSNISSVFTLCSLLLCTINLAINTSRITLRVKFLVFISTNATIMFLLFTFYLKDFQHHKLDSAENCWRCYKSIQYAQVIQLGQLATAMFNVCSVLYFSFPHLLFRNNKTKYTN